MPRCDKYKLRVLQEALVGGCNVGCGGYNVGSYYGGGSYNVGGYAMVVYSTLHKQLCREFGVNHNCVCIISKGPLMYVVTCLGTFCNLNKLF